MTIKCTHTFPFTHLRQKPIWIHQHISCDTCTPRIYTYEVLSHESETYDERTITHGAQYVKQQVSIRRLDISAFFSFFPPQRMHIIINSMHSGLHWFGMFLGVVPEAFLSYRKQETNPAQILSCRPWNPSGMSGTTASPTSLTFMQSQICTMQNDNHHKYMRTYLRSLHRIDALVLLTLNRYF